MKIVKWSAVLVTALLALMNLGTLPQTSLDTWLRVAAALMGLAGVAAAFGLGADLGWGRTAVIGVGVINVVAAIIGLATGTEGAAIGLVVGALGTILGALSPAADARPVEA
jgi:hypothetical protein